MLLVLFRINSRLKCASQAKVAKKSPDPLFWGSRASMSLHAENSSAVLIMTSSKSVPVCKRFHAIDGL